MARKPYPSDVTDGEWESVAPYVTLMGEDGPQREHGLREVFNGMRWIARTGSPWRCMPNDLPPWDAVNQQSRRWLAPGVFDATAQDLRRILRLLDRRREEPTAAIFDSRTLQSTPESGGRAGYGGGDAAEGAEGAPGRRHAGPPAVAARDGGGRAGPGPDRRAREGRAGADGRVGRAGVRRPGLHRGAARRGRRRRSGSGWTS